MDETQPRSLASVNLSMLILARWRAAVRLVFARWGRAELAATDGRALDAWASLESGRWLESLLWLAGGPVVGRREALADPLGSLLAAVVLAAVAPLIESYTLARAPPYWRAVAGAYLGAIGRRPVREPSAWALECLLRCGGDESDLAAVEHAAGAPIDAARLRALAELVECDWESEALSRALEGSEP